MKLKLSYLFLALALTMTIVAGCKDPDTPPEENEEEVITNMVLRFVDSANTSTATTFAFADPDGDGGNAPTIDDITLNAISTYTCTITLTNESDPNNIEDITAEVDEEKAENLFCFTPNTVTDRTTEYSDTDGTFPVGLTTTWRTGAASTGEITVSLKHQPDGLKDGTCDPGETDIEVLFNVTVQ